jgi:hypothetical protein
MTISRMSSVSPFKFIKRWAKSASSSVNKPESLALIQSSSLQQQKYLVDIFRQKALLTTPLRAPKRFPLFTPLQHLRMKVVLPFLNRVLKGSQEKIDFNSRAIKASPLVRKMSTLVALNLDKWEQKELAAMKLQLRYAIPESPELKADVAKIMQHELLRDITHTGGQFQGSPALFSAKSPVSAVKSSLESTIKTLLDVVRSDPTLDPKTIHLSTIENAAALAMRDQLFNKLRKDPVKASMIQDSPSVSTSVIKKLWWYYEQLAPDGIQEEQAQIHALKEIARMLDTTPGVIIPLNRGN